MATKKTAEVVNEEVQAAEPVAEEEPQSEWEIEVEMLVPRKPKGDDPQYYVCVNDRRFYIPANGKMQKMPKPIAEVLRMSLEAEAEAEEFADSIPNKTGPAQEI